MDRRKQVLTQIIQASDHQIDVTYAAMWYIQSEWMTVAGLAKIFNVSVNTIAHWFCEAVSKGYIDKFSVCEQLINKHLMEYEKKYNLENSSLREMYQYALEMRKLNILIEN